MERDERQKAGFVWEGEDRTSRENQERSRKSLTTAQELGRPLREPQEVSGLEEEMAKGDGDDDAPNLTVGSPERPEGPGGTQF